MNEVKNSKIRALTIIGNGNIKYNSLMNIWHFFSKGNLKV